jgi:hypothetical protein
MSPWIKPLRRDHMMKNLRMKRKERYTVVANKKKGVIFVFWTRHYKGNAYTLSQPPNP